MSKEQQFCTFLLDNLFLGVEVLKVQEVIRYQDMTYVPLAPTIIRGLINLRGQIVVAIDLRRRLGLGERQSTRLPMNVVVRTDDGPVSLLVDEIGDVIEVGDDSFEKPPETINAITRSLIHGVYKLKNKLLLILDTEKAIAIETV